jgi:predicted DNA binding CopG/RHH family protein
MRKTIPTFKTDEEAEAFVDTADLSEYDLSGHFVKFELRKKDRAVSLRLPEQLYEAVKKKAESVGVPYQRFIRMAIENALRPGPAGK